ncbi:RodZ domain-containing protein [Inquilinus sp. NPDC058860]|uniref:helix-turn-helix domain-containing protein n=1 Tax=Inquilinus sp. NPDC058860 TaxID=3346652 RepID=UPI00368A2C3A
MAQSNRKHLAVVHETADSPDNPLDAGAVDHVIDMNAPVGRILAQAREIAGYSLYDVAAALRIRHGLLQAIEDGRNQDLPGPVYAIGFVRTYAELLGFDGDQMVARFKRESTAVEKKPDLVFPAPVPEGSRVPGGAILMIAVLIGGLAYAGWYYLSSANRDVAAEIAALPARFAALLDGAPQTEPNPGPVVQPAAPNSGPSLQSAAPVAEPGPGERMTAGPIVPGPTAPAGTPALPSVAAPAAPTEIAAVTAPPAAAPAAPQVAQAQPVPPQLPATMALADRPLGAALANEPPAPQVPGPGDSRIMLRASADSWVQIRDRQGGLVMTRVMAAGETYAVPPQEGQRLTTGNAGGLQVEVDGQPVAALGGPGQVVRNIALDPQKLRGTPAASN